MLHQVRTDYADVLVACDRFRLRDSVFETVRNERERRSFVKPLLRNRMGKNKYRHSQGMSAAPAMGEVECPPSRHQSPCRCTCLPKVLGSLRRYPEDHLRARQSIFGVAAEVPSQEPLATITHRCFGTVV